MREVDDDADAELVDQPRDVALGQALQVVRADQHAEARDAAALDRQPADVADVDRAFEVNPGAQGRPTPAGRRDSTPPSSVWWFSISAISVAPDGHRGAVQRVHVHRLAAVRPIPDVEPARLEVGRVRGRGQLAVALLRRQPGLEVVLLDRRRARGRRRAMFTTRYGISSACRISSSIASSRSCSAARLRRLDEREHLDLVELVHAEDPARVLARGARLAPEARREARVAARHRRP